MKMRNLLLALSLAMVPTLTVAADKAAAPAAPAAPAAAAPNAANAAILAEKARADKKALVATNMALTDAESQGFWPLYDEYQKSLDDLNGRHVKAVAEFAEAQKKGQVTDDTSRKLIDDMLAAEQGEVDLRKSMVPKLSKVLPPIKVARYLQLENKMRTIVRAQLSQHLPMVGGPPPTAQQAQQAQQARQARQQRAK